MNYFSPYTSAERYAKGRPNFHDNSILHVKEFLKLASKFDSALDVGCGTGLSTQALLKIAHRVYGTDSSQAMLSFALQKEKIVYQVSNAIEQPFENNFFDLVSVCSGVHWFEIDEFLSEANRILKSKFWLILYDNFFLGEMEGKPEFKSWYEHVYLQKFPPPKRNDNYNWEKEELKNMNFDFVSEEKFLNQVSLNKNELILYFTTQSNIISEVETNHNSYKEVERWLDTELSKFFIDAQTKQIIIFGNWIKYLKKIK